MTSLPDAAFIVIPLVLVALLVWATVATYQGRLTIVVAVAVSAALWMAATWLAAASGVLRLWDATPPPFLFLLAGILVVSLALPWSPLGTRIIATVPLWALVLAQAFRLPLELAMHSMYERGVMPVQMSYSGRNFDIVTGATALIVAVLALRRSGRPFVLAWNWLGLLLVLNVATVGVLSTPRFAVFGEDQLNIWITYPPYVWLPSVMVVAAITGHLLIFRALSRNR